VESLNFSPRNSGVLPVWADAVAAGATWYGQATSCLNTHQVTGRYPLNSNRLQYLFSAVEGPDSPAYVDLTAAGFTYRRQYTVASLPNVGDEITFAPQHIISSSQGTAGTVVVRSLNTNGTAAGVSVFQEADEVQLRLTARGQSQTISFVRANEIPNCYVYLSMPNYAAPRYAQSAIFKHTDQQHGVSWIVAIEPTCSWFGKLEIHLFGKLPIPGTNNQNVFTEAQSITFQGRLSEDAAAAAPHYFHNDYETSSFGQQAFPAFPLTLWSNYPSWSRNSFGQMRRLEPFVVVDIVGVL
jgi:hypothetical protein